MGCHRVRPEGGTSEMKGFVLFRLQLASRGRGVGRAGMSSSLLLLGTGSQTMRELTGWFLAVKLSAP